jgi:NAD-dependent SIR2 family protein deacetylase
MIKLGLFASIAAIVGALAVATSTDALAGDPCVHTEFKTEMVKAACAKGGQAAAKEAMQAFNKEKKITSCNKCHSSLKPKYDLKDDGLKQYQDLKGDDSAAAKAVK